jgi:hypothetical protein
MFGKICSWFGGLVQGLKSRLGLAVAAASVGIVAVSSGTVFAQTAMPIPLEPPNIAWDQLPGTLIGVLTTPVVVGIGVALSIWVILKAMAFFKRAT